MERFNRAVRRHHVARLKQKRKNYWGYPTVWHAGLGEIDRYTRAPQGMDPRQLGRVVQYPQACSCASCGNVRRWPWMNDCKGYTLQEIRYFDQYKEQLQELEE